MSRAASLAVPLIAVAGVLVAGAARAGAARCWIDRGAVVVAAAFGDIAGDFILDASAPRSLLHLTRARSDGIDAPAATRRLVVAGERIDGLEMTVADLDARSIGFPTSINGVIGDDVLRRFVVEIDFEPCRIVLGRRLPAPWKGATRLAVRETGGVPAINASISDGLTSRAGLFAIDTARAPSRIAAARLSRPARSGAAVRLRALGLANEIFEQTPAELAPDTSGGVQDSIGTAAWSRWRIRLDLKRGWLDLAPR